MEEELAGAAGAKILVFEPPGVRTKETTFRVAAGGPGDRLLPVLCVHTPTGKHCPHPAFFSAQRTVQRP